MRLNHNVLFLTQIGQVVSDGTLENDADTIEGDVVMLIEQVLATEAKAWRMGLIC